MNSIDGEMAADNDDRLLHQLQLDQQKVRSRARRLVDDYRLFFDGRSTGQPASEEAQIEG